MPVRNLRRVPEALAVIWLVLVGPTGARAAQEQYVRVPGTDVELEAGWQFLTTPDHCAYAVPGSWNISGDARWARPVDRVGSVAVFRVTVASWSAHRAALRSAWRFAAVRKDTPTRLWMEQIEGPRVWDHISVTDGSQVCTADIEADANSTIADLVRKIAESLRVAAVHGAVQPPRAFKGLG
jgi:hypothetical protein